MTDDDWCNYWKHAIKTDLLLFSQSCFLKSFFIPDGLKQDRVCFHPLPVWRWGPAPEDCWSCLWDKKPVKEREKNSVKQQNETQTFWQRISVVLCACIHLLPEVQSPGDISVGVVLLIGSLVKLRLDGLRLYRKLSRNCNR